MSVLASDRAFPACTVNGAPRDDDWATTHAADCDPGTGPTAAAADAPPTPTVDPTTPTAPANGPNDGDAAATPTAPEPAATPAPTPATGDAPAAGDAAATPAPTGDQAAPTDAGAAPDPATPAPADPAPAAPAADATLPNASAPSAGVAPTTATTPGKPTPARVRGGSTPTAATPATAPAPVTPTPGGELDVAPPAAADAAAAAAGGSAGSVHPFVDARLFREAWVPSGTLPDIPKADERIVTEFQQVGADTQVNWSLLASISWMESHWGTRHGAHLAGNRLTPADWKAYGLDGDGNGQVSAGSEGDRLATLANMIITMSEHGGTGVPLRHYFGDDADYVTRANYLGAYFAAVGPVAIVKGLDDPDARAELQARVLTDDRTNVYPGGRSDIEAGLIDPRVLVTIEFVTNRYGYTAVTSLISGHSVFTTSGNVSLHAFGQAVDIAQIGWTPGANHTKVGVPVYGHQEKDGKLYNALKDVLRMPQAMQPKELISLWDLGMPSFALADHDDHMHVGFARATTPDAAGNSVVDATSTANAPADRAVSKDPLLQ